MSSKFYPYEVAASEAFHAAAERNLVDGPSRRDRCSALLHKIFGKGQLPGVELVEMDSLARAIRVNVGQDLALFFNLGVAPEEDAFLVRYLGVGDMWEARTLAGIGDTIERAKYVIRSKSSDDLFMADDDTDYDDNDDGAGARYILPRALDVLLSLIDAESPETRAQIMAAVRTVLKNYFGEDKEAVAGKEAAKKPVA